MNPDQRIIRLIDLLKFEGKVSSLTEFCNEVGISRQTVSKIRRGYPNHFTVQQIEIICKKYKVNANWIFGLEDEIFRDKKTT